LTKFEDDISNADHIRFKCHNPHVMAWVIYQLKDGAKKFKYLQIMVELTTEHFKIEFVSRYSLFIPTHPKVIPMARYVVS
jgi:hypothetical protein